jgi:hypothetical protein
LGSCLPAASDALCARFFATIFFSVGG